MPDPSAAVALLQQRLRLVAELSALNAEALKCNQRIGGLEMDLQRLELADTQPADEAAEEGSAFYEGELAAAEAALADCHRPPRRRRGCGGGHRPRARGAALAAAGPEGSRRLQDRSRP